MHQPVLLKETIEYLKPAANENFVDGTLGLAGHTRAILERIKPKGRVLGIERDPSLVALVKKEKLERLIVVLGSFADLEKIVQDYNFFPVSGILLDLGMSSWHIEKSGRGFSFLRNEPLLMNFSPGVPYFAVDIVNKFPQEEIERILKEYGEERFYRRIARAIINQRKKSLIKTTFDLVALLKSCLPSAYQKKSRIHFATRTFQALRIAVNGELENIKKFLPQALKVLEKEGRLAIISFHSLEDRLVKNFFKEKAKEGVLRILTKKPIMASFEEIKINRRARSAKLRVCQKL